MLAARSAEQLAALAGALTGEGAVVLAVPCDMRSAAELAGLAAQALERWAGRRLDPERRNWRGRAGCADVAGASAATIETTLLAPIELTRLLLP